MNETRQRLKLWDLPVMDSRIRSSDVTLSEMIFGYFLGPFLVLAMTTVISTYYLTFYRTYDDILSSASSFLVLLPLISVIPMALANIIVGIVIFPPISSLPALVTSKATSMAMRSSIGTSRRS